MNGKQLLDILCSNANVMGITDKSPEDAVYRATMLGWLNLVSEDIQNRQTDWHWRFLEKTATASTVSDQHSYDLPSDIYEHKIVSLYDRTNDITMTYVPYERFVKRVADPSNDSGDTVWWTIFATTLRLYPVPSSVYTFYMDYIRRLDDISDTNDTLAYPDNWKRVLIEGALYWAYRFDPQMGDANAQYSVYSDLVSQRMTDNRQIISEIQQPVSHLTRWNRTMPDGRDGMEYPLEGDSY